ncbi:hypothetical protein AB0P07_11960 [Streptomyces sp. NPDC085944]|uniref:hypothetical protein n=1 Tax=Streptomyces sp. NPDC085944 TaxID=3154962 RepID=UPI003445F8DD
MTFPKLTPTERIADPRCGWKPDADSPAHGAPATWHIAWHLVYPADFSLVCDEHMAVIQRDMVYADRHPAELACDMPGTGWLTTDPSRCVMATTDDRQAHRQADAS